MGAKLQIYKVSIVQIGNNVQRNIISDMEFFKNGSELCNMAHLVSLQGAHGQDLFHPMRKVSNVQPPVAVTISGATPASKSSTAPPILKLCPNM